MLTSGLWEDRLRTYFGSVGGGECVERSRVVANDHVFRFDQRREKDGLHQPVESVSGG
jgi:hypothetical protein